MPFIDATDKIWEQYSKVMCKWLSVMAMVNIDKIIIISTNNMGREIGDFLSDEIFFPTTMLAQIIKVVKLLADNKEGMHNNSRTKKIDEKIKFKWSSNRCMFFRAC